MAVVSKGTRVLGLGNIGPLAGKPVMEGKAVLFKRFADVDVFDLEVNSDKPEDIVKFCQLLEPTVGGINLEDIKTPDCFLVEKTLQILYRFQSCTMTSTEQLWFLEQPCSVPCR